MKNTESADRTYIRMRELLIPAAEQHADELIGAEPRKGADRVRWAARWNAAFHGEMERLVRAGR